ncbi:MAG: selenoneine synthase SenA [Rhodospirillales bacterium]|jgi:iron(II)-dependent oxidoreductase
MTSPISAPVASNDLITEMHSARQRTLELIDGLTPEQLVGPKLPTVNPLLWEIGHVAWFHEHFILRREYGHESLLAQGDSLYDSIAIAHGKRWDLSVYPLDDMKRYMADVLDTLVERLPSNLSSPRDSYLYQFTTLHEDMHCEAFTSARQTLAYPTPRFKSDGRYKPYDMVTGQLPGDAHIPGGTFPLGSMPGSPFIFDNEKWAHDITLSPFSMAIAPVTNEQFAAFVESGSYECKALWCEDGWRWRSKAGARHPIYWARDGVTGWRVRRFDTWQPLPPHQPVLHVNWYEASAWCRWARRRLPKEAEWEFAARWRPDGNGGFTHTRYPWGNAIPESRHANLDGYALGCVDVAAHRDGDNIWGCRQLLGNVWEWTADTFGPFPGFSPDDYKEYSEPLFGETKVLRGGAWATRSRMISSVYRNYFKPDRRDIFAGFRTCAL